MNDLSTRKSLIVHFNPYGSPFFNPKCLFANVRIFSDPVNMLKNIVSQYMHLRLTLKAFLQKRCDRLNDGYVTGI